MINLGSHHPYHVLCGTGKPFITCTMKRLSYFIITIMLLICCSKQKPDDANNISVHCSLIENDNELVYSIKNASRSNLFILGLKSQTFPEVIKKKKYDSIWQNFSVPFYNELRVLKDTSEIFNPPDDEEYEYKPEKNKPETNTFFNLVIQKIKDSKLSLKSDLLLEFDLLMSGSSFLKPGESYSDTIPLSAFKSKYPKNDLKFIFEYPSVFLYKSEKSYLTYYAEDFLGDSLHVVIPEKLDGYKFVYKGNLKYEFIVSSDD